MTSNRLHRSFCCNFPFMNYILPIMLALCLILSTTYFAQNYASIIDLGLLVIVIGTMGMMKHNNNISKPEMFVWVGLQIPSDEI